MPLYTTLWVVARTGISSQYVTSWVFFVGLDGSGACVTIRLRNLFSPSGSGGEGGWSGWSTFFLFSVPCLVSFFFFWRGQAGPGWIRSCRRRVTSVAMNICISSFSSGHFSQQLPGAVNKAHILVLGICNFKIPQSPQPGIRWAPLASSVGASVRAHVPRASNRQRNNCFIAEVTP